MAITTYSELKAAIVDWSARDDFSSKADEFIDLCEAMFRRPYSHPTQQRIGGLRANKTRTTGTLTAGTNSLSLPSDFLEMDRLELTADGIILEFLTPDALTRYSRTGSGQPSFFTIEDAIYFDVTPDSAHAYGISYWPQPAALSDSNTSNWLLANFPDVYLAGCMYWACRYKQDIEMASTWAQQYKDGVSMASMSYNRGRTSQGAVSIVFDGVTP